MASPSWQPQRAPLAPPASPSSWQSQQQLAPSRQAAPGAPPLNPVRPSFRPPPNGYSSQAGSSVQAPHGHPSQGSIPPSHSPSPSSFSQETSVAHPPAGPFFGPPGTGNPLVAPGSAGNPASVGNGSILGGPSPPNSNWNSVGPIFQMGPRPAVPFSRPLTGGFDGPPGTLQGRPTGAPSYRSVQQVSTAQVYGQFPSGPTQSPSQSIPSNSPPLGPLDGPLQSFPPGVPPGFAPLPLSQQPLLSTSQQVGPPQGPPWLNAPLLQHPGQSSGQFSAYSAGHGTTHASQQPPLRPLPAMGLSAHSGNNSRLPQSPNSATFSAPGEASSRALSSTGMTLAPLPLNGQWRSQPVSSNVESAIPPGESVVKIVTKDAPLAPPGVSVAGTGGSTGGASAVASISGGALNMEAAAEGSEAGNDETGEHGIEADAWTAHKAENGTVYYFNSVTGVSTFDRPRGFQLEAEKVTSQPTPIDWKRIAGTEWALVTTDDGKKYYYNTVNQATSWQLPLEVAELKQKAHEEATPKVSSTSVPGRLGDKNPISFSLHAPAASTGGREAAGHRALVAAMGASALEQIKKKLQDSGAPTGTPAIANSGEGALGAASGHVNGAGGSAGGIVLPGIQNAPSEGKEVEKEGQELSDSSDDDSEDEGKKGRTKEEEIGQFKAMLKEKGVAPFSKWERELPKIIFDPRFKAIPSHKERKEIFEHYVKTRAEEERKEKRAAQKAAVEGFKQLLEEVAEMLDHSFDHNKFAEMWGTDARFQALDRKDRQTLLSERLAPLKKVEEERQRAEHEQAVAGFNELLAEQKDLTSGTRWSKVKDNLRSDPRYTALGWEHRETLFDSHIAAIRATEEAAERTAQAKREEEDRQREREREARKRKEREEADHERARVRARRREAMAQYETLLAEKVKDPEASWSESRSRLEKDERGTPADLDANECEALFREHCSRLLEKCRADYKELLVELITTDAAAMQDEEGRSILLSWTEAKKVLKGDARHGALPRRERETLWREHADALQIQRKADKGRGRAREADETAENGRPNERARDSDGRKREGGRDAHHQETEKKGRDRYEGELRELEKRKKVDKRNDDKRAERKTEEKRGERRDEDKRQHDGRQARQDGEKTEVGRTGGSWKEESRDRGGRDEKGSSKRGPEGSRHREGEGRNTRHRSR